MRTEAISPQEQFRAPMIRDGMTFYKVRVNAGGYVLMVEWVVGCLTMHQLLSEWIESAINRK